MKNIKIKHLKIIVVRKLDNCFPNKVEKLEKFVLRLQGENQGCNNVFSREKYWENDGTLESLVSKCFCPKKHYMSK